jgi:hypothetical protein
VELLGDAPRSEKPRNIYDKNVTCLQVEPHETPTKKDYKNLSIELIERLGDLVLFHRERIFPIKNDTECTDGLPPVILHS